MQYNNKFRIESARLKTWDYSTPGNYFVTICTNNREHHFGEIHNGAVILSMAGQIAHTIWNEIPNQFIGAQPDECIIMPNHIHGIISLSDGDIDRHGSNDGGSNNDDDDDDDGGGGGGGGGGGRDVINHVSTGTGTGTGTGTPTNTRTGGITGTRNPMVNPRSLSTIIRWFKGRTTFEINKISPNNLFKWQPRFHDVIIRSAAELLRIRQYIRNNPAHWQEDDFCG